MKILILEDNEALCSIMQKTLVNESYIVHTFSDGNKALNAINNGYSCFILDINVPSIDGIEVLKYIRLHNKDIPIIIISSNHELNKIQLSYEKGCNEYLKKPFFMYELVHKVKSLCKLEDRYIIFDDNYNYTGIPRYIVVMDPNIFPQYRE